MRFRELYQADFANITPRAELLAAAKGLYQQLPRRTSHLLSPGVRASALGLAACLLLAVGLHFALPGASSETTETGSGDAPLMIRSAAQPDDMPQQARMRAAVPESVPAALSEALSEDAATPELCSLPLSDYENDSQLKVAYFGLQPYFDSSLLPQTDSESQLKLADFGLQPGFVGRLLPQAPNSAAYLTRCGLWLVYYTWFD